MYNNSSDGSGQLPVSQDEILRNMQAAAPAQRRGGKGETYARIDCRTGARTFGRDDTPLPDHRFAVPWREVAWGYKEFAGKTVVKAAMKPIAAGACPMPAGDFTPYGVDGPKACMELRLCSLNEPGFGPIYSCLNDSGSSRILDLWGEITAQYQVNPQFANPVVKLVSDSFTNSYGTTFVLTYDIVDWLHDDGTTLLSQVQDTPRVGNAAAELPF